MNPIQPDTRVEAARKLITRISYRHGEALTLLIGIILGFVMGKL